MSALREQKLDRSAKLGISERSKNHNYASVFFSVVVVMVTGVKSSVTGGKGGTEMLTHPADVLHRCWSSGSPSRARAALLRPASQPPLSPTAPPSQPIISTGPRSQTQPPRS